MAPAWGGAGARGARRVALTGSWRRSWRPRCATWAGPARGRAGASPGPWPGVGGPRRGLPGRWAAVAAGPAPGESPAANPAARAAASRCLVRACALFHLCPCALFHPCPSVPLHPLPLCPCPPPAPVHPRPVSLFHPCPCAPARPLPPCPSSTPAPANRLSLCPYSTPGPGAGGGGVLWSLAQPAGPWAPCRNHGSCQWAGEKARGTWC